MSLVLDFGSTNTVLRYGRINRRLATAIAIDRRTGRAVSVGDEAHRLDGRAPSHFEVIRPVSRGVVADLKMARRFLREFLRHTLGWRRRALRDVVLVVASGLSRLEATAFLEAARWAGARTSRVVDRALSSALAAGVSPAQVEGAMVVDVGGQTTEAAVLSSGGLTVSRRACLGGEDLTRAIRRGLHEQRHLEVGLDEAESLKRSAGSASGIHVRTGLARGRDSSSGLPRTDSVHSEELLEWMEPVLRRIYEQVRLTLDQLPPELAGDLADRGVLLTGGGSLLPGMEESFEQALGLPVRRVEAGMTAPVEVPERLPGQP